MLYYTLNMIAPSEVLVVNRDILFVPNETHTHEFVEMEYIISGTGVQIINGVEYNVKRGDIVFIDIGDEHSYYSTNKIIVFNLIIHPALYEVIKKSLLSVFIDKSCRIPCFVRVSLENIFEIEELILKIEQEFTKKQDGYKQILNNYLTILFIDIYRKVLYIDMSENDLLAKSEIIDYIDNNYTHFKLSDIAEKFNYTPAYFSKYFKKIMGMTLSSYLHRKKSDLAIKLLINTELSIEEIMRELGYSDKKNFYNIFKIYVGSTPNEIRRSALRQNSIAEKQNDRFTDEILLPSYTI
ncbi:MAG: AraC family transcriptional regulator [Saccharofermentanales bacterium]